jgi:hypothetical protein
LSTYLSQDYKDNYIQNKKNELTQEYEDEVAKVREEALTKYTGDMIADFTNPDYLEEAIRWNNGMSQEELEEINAWAMGKYNMTGA